MFENEKVIPVELVKEMKKSYIDYAMSVIVGRALPDVRDGLKPVHRRILYTMFEAGLLPERPYRKCATTVGDVLGKYHPHGDAAVYDSLVRMAQDFSLRYPLVDGHGNFGSVDGDSPAAYRYTEAKMPRLSLEMLRDIDKETVSFTPNYDDRLMEPSVLPSRFPNLLANGSSGIAVGMATNIPPHNLSELINAINHVIDNPETSVDEIMEFIKGPDFPTYGIILGRSGIREAYKTGRGKIIMRARHDIEEEQGHTSIVFTEIPYQVNKSRLVEKIADLANEKRIEGISFVRDESDRDGLRIVVRLRKDANCEVTLNQLFKFTQLQENFSVNMIALVDGQPRLLNLREILDCYIDFQRSVITKRTVFEKNKAEARAHILEGFVTAIDNIDEVIAIIRRSYNTAKKDLMERFGFTDVQAQAILDMRLARLSGIEREKIENELEMLLKLIENLKEILSNPNMVDDIIKTELSQIKEKFGDERRSEIISFAGEINDEDLIPDEECVVTLTHRGYIKRMAADSYKTQKRGGKGMSGIQTREEDFVQDIFACTTHSFILFFTDKGRMYKIKAYQVPETGRQAKGTPVVNLFQIEPDENITAVITVDGFSDEYYLLMMTKYGVIKKTRLSEYGSVRKGGIRAIELDDGDSLTCVKLTDGSSDIIIGTNKALAIRFSEKDVRCVGRVSRGVRGIALSDGDYVVGMSSVKSGEDILIITEKGYGKRTSVDEYRCQQRAGKGVISYSINDDTGNILTLVSVSDDEDAIFITSEGVVIRIKVSTVNRLGRFAKGVKIMRLEENVNIVACAIVKEERDGDEEIIGDITSDSENSSSDNDD